MAASILLIVAVGFAVYANSLNGKFLRDDNDLIRDNPFITSPAGIKAVFTQNIAAGVGRKWNSYRPLQMMTYMGDYALWKLNVRGYHFVGILLHVLAALLVFWLANILLPGNLLAATLSGLFFVAHPVHTEAVAFVSGRADPLAAVFLLGALVAYIKHLRSRQMGFLAFAGVGFALALLSRENSLVLPVLLLIYHAAFKERFVAKSFLPIAVIAAVYITVRATILRSLLSNIVYDTTFFQRLPGFFVALFNYLRLLVFPFHLHMEYENRVFYFSDPRVWAGIALLVLLGAGISKLRRSDGFAFFSLSWFFVTLLPHANLYPINAYMAEHWLYLPCVGIFLLLGRGLGRLIQSARWKAAGQGLTVALLIFFAVRTVGQNTYWREPLSFYQRTLHYAPDSALMHNALGAVYYDLGEYAQALASYQRSMQLDPQLGDPYFNSGNAYLKLGQKEQAAESFKKAAEVDPTFPNAFNNLGFVYNEMGRHSEAIPALEKAVEIDPRYAKAYNNLGISYGSVGRMEDAKKAFEKAIESDPRYGDPYGNLSLIYFLAKQYDLAIAYCDKSLQEGYQPKPGFLESLQSFRKR